MSTSNGLDMASLAELIKRQEQVGWSKAMNIAIARKEQAERRREAERQAARARRRRVVS